MRAGRCSAGAQTRRAGRPGAGPAAGLVAAVAAVAAVTLAAGPATAAGPPNPFAPAPGPRSTVGGAELARTGTVVSPGEPALPPVAASGWLVADLDTGAVLAAHDAHGRYAPASTLKLLTALTVVPQLALTRRLTATSAEVNVDGTRVGVVPDRIYTVAMLLRGMLMVSGNDAARVLAGAVGGEAAVATEMNAKARSIQADDTHAATVTGLDAAGQFTSAYDLALIGRADLALPTVRIDVDTQISEFYGAGVAKFQISNHNPLLGNTPGVYGMKNGYTVAAQASYVGVARRGGHDIIVTMIHSTPGFETQAKALLDWGFAADASARPVGLLVPPAAPVATSATPVPKVAGVSTVATRHPLRRSGLGALDWSIIGAGAGLLLLLAARFSALRRRRGRHRSGTIPFRFGS